MSLDLQLTTNEALLFNSDRTEFIHKQKLRDIVHMTCLSGRSEHAKVTGKLTDLPQEEKDSKFEYASSKASRYSEFDDLKSKMAQSTQRSLAQAS